MSCIPVSVHTHPINFLEVSATPRNTCCDQAFFWEGGGGGSVKVELGEGAEKCSVVDYALLNKDYMVKKDIARKKKKTPDRRLPLSLSR